VLVLDGSFDGGGDRFAAQSWLRLPCGDALHATAGSGGCVVWLKTGHLRDILGIRQTAAG